MPAARPRSDGNLVLGVDLGTTNSVVAVVQDGGDDVDVLDNDVGRRLTPSCVHVGADLTLQVGDAALRVAVSDPAHTVRNVKRVLGLPVEAVKADVTRPLGAVPVGNANDGPYGSVLVLGDGVRLTAEEVAAALLYELKKAAEAQLGRVVSQAVITVPTYFNAAQRHALRDVGHLAGLKVLQLVNEPTAAALRYAYDKGFDKTVVVVDVGGGGSSISVLRVENNKVTVLASSGQRLPGGEDFDITMLGYLRDVIREQHGRAVEDERTLELLRTHWEKAKQKLSRIPATKIVTFLPDVGLEFEHEVKRADLERCDPLFREITDALKGVLEVAKTAPEAVDDVLLVGGSTRLPRLRDLVQEALGGKRLCRSVHQDEDVAKGAALLGAGLCAAHDLTPLRLDVHLDGDVHSVLAGTELPHSLDLRGLVPGRVMVRQGPWVAQGEMPMACIVEMNKKSRGVIASLQLDVSGLFDFLDTAGRPLHVAPRGCLSARKLEELQAKHETRQREQAMEQHRMEAKNALEDKCRTLLLTAVQISDDEDFTDAKDIDVLKQKCEEGLEWLKNNENAPLQDVEGKMSEIGRLESEVNARRDERRAQARRAREAETRQAEARRALEQRRMEAKNALEDKCRTLLNMAVQISEDFTDAKDVKVLKQKCQEGLEWLMNNENAPLQNVEGKMSEICRLESEVNARRDERRAQARQARRAWEMETRQEEARLARLALEERCNAVVEMQVPADVGCRDVFSSLRDECLSNLHWLHTTPAATHEEIDSILARVCSMQDALEEKMRVRERKAAASTVLAPSTASAASNQQRGARQAHRDQRWTDDGSTNASNVSGRDRWQGEQFRQPSFTRNYRSDSRSPDDWTVVRLPSNCEVTSRNKPQKGWFRRLLNFIGL